MIPYPLFIYYIIVVIITMLLISTAVSNNVNEDPESSDIHTKQNLLEIIINHESGWIKILAHISLLLLTACLVYHFSSYKLTSPQISPCVGILAITSLVNLFFAGFHHLSSFFFASYILGHQKRHSLHKALFKISAKLNTFWHLTPFLFMLVQFVLAGHILVTIFYC